MATHRIMIHSGPTALANWSDVSGDFASRVYPGPGQSYQVWRAKVGVGLPNNIGRVTMVARAQDLATETGLEDVDLGGKLYRWSWGHVPVGMAPPALVLTAGLSGEVTWEFNEQQPGLWLLVAWRDANGSAGLPIEVVVG
jgi:hypothetical protein